MSRFLSIVVCVCLVSLALSGQPEASTFDGQQMTNDPQPSSEDRDEVAGPENGNLQGPLKGSGGTTSIAGDQMFNFKNQSMEDNDTGSTQNDTSNGEDTDSNSDEAVPLRPLGQLPPDFEDEEGDTDPGGNKLCDYNLCNILDHCESIDKVCVMAEDCSMLCVPPGNISTTPRTLRAKLAETTTKSEIPGLRPWSERTCHADYGYICVHGVCSKSMTCHCDEGWGGTICAEPCNRSCGDHGRCRLDNHTQRCNCMHDYQGAWCDEPVPDPKGITERARILAAILSSTLAVAVILAVVVPVVMWKMRMTFVLKFVYYFKEYEDEDGKTYDAYVSMTPTLNAENFVYSSLRPILEELNFTLYLQARDAPGGEVLSETILSALEKSRRTIMIVTRDYITNEWNRFEYLIAQHETLKLKQRIIPIILEDIDKDRTKMDKSLKHILDSIKCLKYPQAKPESLNGVELSDIQSPDSNRSADSTRYFFRRQGQNSNTASTSKEDQKLEKKVAKFWKHLTLTMPKKKSKEEKSLNILAKLRSQSSYDVTKDASQYSSQHENNKEGSNQPILDLDYKKTVFNSNLDNDGNFDVQIIDLCKDGKNMKNDELCNNTPSLQVEKLSIFIES